MEEPNFDQEESQETPDENLEAVEPTPDTALETPAEIPPKLPAEPPMESPLPPRPEDMPETGTSDLSATPEPMEDALGETEQQKEPTKFQLFMRKALTWLGIGAVVFLAGFATFYFTLYQPKVDALEQTEAQLTQANDDIQALESELADAQSEAEALAEADAHQALTSVMVNLYAARLALVEEDTVAAKSALNTTAATLSEITDLIAGFDAGLAETLPQRLNLVITNIDRDPETAISDCDQMLKDLSQAESVLFP